MHLETHCHSGCWQGRGPGSSPAQRMEPSSSHSPPDHGLPRVGQASFVFLSGTALPTPLCWNLCPVLTGASIISQHPLWSSVLTLNAIFLGNPNWLSCLPQWDDSVDSQLSQVRTPCAGISVQSSLEPPSSPSILFGLQF